MAVDGVMSLVLAGGMGYCLGSVPFGLMLTRLAGAGDLRTIGSGNIGATNVLRTGRKGIAAATLLLDMAKGTVAVLLAGAFWPVIASGGGDAGAGGPAQVAAVGAMLGHCYPVWLRFRGGKGVATVLGVALGLSWQAGLVAALAWLVLAYVTRISSVGGMGAALVAPIAALALGQSAVAPALMALAGLVILRHHANIARLFAGTEPRIGQTK